MLGSRVEFLLISSMIAVTIQFSGIFYFYFFKSLHFTFWICHIDEKGGSVTRQHCCDVTALVQPFTDSIYEKIEKAIIWVAFVQKSLLLCQKYVRKLG